MRSLRGLRERVREGGCRWILEKGKEGLSEFMVRCSPRGPIDKICPYGFPLANGCFKVDIFLGFEGFLGRR
ncbi:hypothetical protein RHMOL_Rhmol03G0131200 [Rhododendron molle]|uniref:Uncharacterized protein n=1 Tax=Rhododendron molle TaxID=49168 RepID=A0ACC0PE05_RHOML|nr:hypothetical protein RHMOL_Rhmol03G0131200 [Rhododendron molle]